MDPLQSLDRFYSSLDDVINFDFPDEIRERLDELAEDLRGTLRVIAYAGHASNLEFIRERQRDLRKAYGDLVSDSLSMSKTNPLNFTSERLAYAKFMDVLDFGVTSEEIVRECEGILSGYLVE